MSKNLFARNGRYYYRQWLPLDLRHLFGNKAEVIKSLKTSDKREALTLSASLHQRFSVTFTVLRTGLLSPEMIDSLLSPVLTPPQPKEPPVETTILHSLKLSRLIELYTVEHSPKWTPKSHLEIDKQFKLLLMVLTDVPISQIDRETCITCRDTLRRLPPGFTRIKRLRDLSISELLKVNAQGDGLHPATVNKYMILLSSLFKWSMKHGYTGNNPSEGLTIELETRPEEERKAYSRDDLKKVIHHCNKETEPSRKWIPVIAMYSGMRLEEISQLTTADIKDVDGVLCFDVNNQGDKRIKSKSSRRLVPVHPTLIGMGLLDHLNHRKREGEVNLWSLSRGKWGYGKNVGNWYGNYFNRQYITQDPLKCFHSFRHSFTDTLKQVGVQENLIAELIGHSNGSITTGRYGKRYQPGVLLEVVKRVDYELCRE